MTKRGGGGGGVVGGRAASKRGSVAGVLGLALAAGACVLAAAAPAEARDKRILLVGDSWAHYVWKDRVLRGALDRAGLGFAEEEGSATAIGGTTASLWAQPMGLGLIQQALLSHPTIDIVHLSLGGNDLLGSYHASQSPADRATLWATIRADVQTVVDACLAFRPGMRVLIVGYDYLNLIDPALAGHGGALNTWLLKGTPTAAQINGAFLELALELKSLADQTPGCAYLPSFGLMQRAYGYAPLLAPGLAPPPASAATFQPFPGGLPDLPSPVAALDGQTDPIHLSEDGYALLMDRVVAEVYAYWLRGLDFPGQVNGSSGGSGAGAGGNTGSGGTASGGAGAGSTSGGGGSAASASGPSGGDGGGGCALAGAGGDATPRAWLWPALAAVAIGAGARRVRSAGRAVAVRAASVAAVALAVGCAGGGGGSTSAAAGTSSAGGASSAGTGAGGGASTGATGAGGSTTTTTAPTGGGGAPPAPTLSAGAQIFGQRYWDVYRPHFLAHFYEQGIVNDRIEAGTKMFGDATAFMSYALSMFVFEYQAAGFPESLEKIAEILDAYERLDTLDGDPRDGYVVRADRGPDYTTNLWTRNNEPSGDQIMATLRALRDVVDFPGPLVHGGRDLKQMARERAALLGFYVKRDGFRLKNRFGDLVKRGDDQRWPAWAITRACANVSGLPQSLFEGSWDLFGVSIGAGVQEAITSQWLQATFDFVNACVSGRSIHVGGFTVNVGCNEFNVSIAGNVAVAALDTDPASPRWFSRVIDRQSIIQEQNALYAMYARYKFGDLDPGLQATCGIFLDAPATPPSGDNFAPNGWCRAFRWLYDNDDPNRCLNHPYWLQSYGGLDYMLCRAMASAYGEFPE